MTASLRVALVALLLAAAVAAGADAAPAVSAPAEDEATIVHVLNRVTFGPRPQDIGRVRAVGLARWLEQQLDPGRLADESVERQLAALPTLSKSIGELQREYARPDRQMREKMAAGDMTRRELLERYPIDKRPARITAELEAARLLRAVHSERQLQEVMVDFWFNHFNVFADKGRVRWFVASYERDVIRPHALGTFPDLLRATARHPAMLFYLDNWLSTRADFTRQGGPNKGEKAGLNENYARELMELHTLGVDGGYTQKDVTEVARAFTGWTIDRAREDARFVFRPLVHDRAEKTVLGTRLPAGGGQQDGERVLDLLARHPATARFVAGKLVRRFVGDAPPPALVDRVAAVYGDTGGDVRAMLRAIFASPEFTAPDARRAKIKKPFEFVASAARAVDATADARGAFALARATAEIGEPLFVAQPPTGYPDRAEAWVNAGALLARMNFALALTQRRLPGVTAGVAALVTAQERVRPGAALDRLLDILLHGAATPETRAVLTAHLDDAQIIRKTADDRGPADTDIEKLAALVLGSPEFQRR
jgi:uncharacterized protein (DUF1800 family)